MESKVFCLWTTNDNSADRTIAHGTLRIFIPPPVSQPTLSASMWLMFFLFLLPWQIRPGRTIGLVSVSQQVFPFPLSSASVWFARFPISLWVERAWSGPWREGHLGHLIALISSEMPSDHFRDGACYLSSGTSALFTCKDVSPWQDPKPSH